MGRKMRNLGGDSHLPNLRGRSTQEVDLLKVSFLIKNPDSLPLASSLEAGSFPISKYAACFKACGKGSIIDDLLVVFLVPVGCFEAVPQLAGCHSLLPCFRFIAICPVTLLY